MNDQKAIQNIHQQWLDFEVAGTGKSVITLCSNDVLWLIPGTGGIRGKKAVEDWLDNQPTVNIERIEILKMNLEISDFLAIKTAEFKTYLQGSDGLIMPPITGTHLWTLRQDSASGQWLVNSVSWSIL